MEAVDRRLREVAIMLLATDAHMRVLASLRTDEPTPRVARSLLLRRTGGWAA